MLCSSDLNSIAKRNAEQRSATCACTCHSVDVFDLERRHRRRRRWRKRERRRLDLAVHDEHDGASAALEQQVLEVFALGHLYVYTVYNIIQYNIIQCTIRVQYLKFETCRAPRYPRADCAAAARASRPTGPSRLPRAARPQLAAPVRLPRRAL